LTFSSVFFPSLLILHLSLFILPFPFLLLIFSFPRYS
jgi:hypothetical protein